MALQHTSAQWWKEIQENSGCFWVTLAVSLVSCQYTGPVTSHSSLMGSGTFILASVVHLDVEDFSDELLHQH